MTLSCCCILAVDQYVEPQRLDGKYNNMDRPNEGSTGSHFMRQGQSTYIDGRMSVNRSLPSPRLLSNIFFKGPSGIPNTRGLTTMIAFFGQLVNYEIASSADIACPLETLRIKVPPGDRAFEMQDDDETDIPYHREKFDHETGGGFNAPREQVNYKTSWIDGSFIYSTLEPYISALRTFSNGTLKVDRSGLPVLNIDSIPMGNEPSPQTDRLLSMKRKFLVGDGRSHENPGLLALAIVFHRYHNVWAMRLKEQEPNWTDEQLFLGAKTMVVAILQKIIMYDYLPTLLGNGYPIPPYKRYNPTIPSAVTQGYHVAAGQYIQTLLPSGMYVRSTNSCLFEGDIRGRGALRLCEYWQDAQDMYKYSFGVDQVIGGMASQLAEAEDRIVVEDIRDHYFGSLAYSRQDLVSQTIMKGRDYGLPSYNKMRILMDLGPIDKEDMENLLGGDEVLDLYGDNVDSVDAFVGGMAETNGQLGPLFANIIRRQFVSLRDGDRFWFENAEQNQMRPIDVDITMQTTLKTVIVDALGMDPSLLQDNVFVHNPRNPGKCPIPPPIRAEDLNKCIPLFRKNTFMGSETVYIYSTVGLAIVPVLLVGLGYWLVSQRNRKSRDSSYDEIPVVPTSELETTDRFTMRAFEWLEDSHRQVVVTILKNEIIVRKPRGGLLRKITFAENQVVNVIHSYPGLSKMFGPYCLIKTPKTFDLVIRLPSDTHLQPFLKAISYTMKQVNGSIVTRAQPNEDILNSANTKNRKQARLDYFFREAYARAFNRPDLSDPQVGMTEESDVLNHSITRAELAEAMGMRESDLFIRRMFAVTTKRNNDSLEFGEFLAVLKRFSNASLHDRYKFVFEMCDVDGKGHVNRREIADFILSLNTVGVSLNEDAQNRLIDQVMNGNGISSEEISLSDFERIFKETEQRTIGMDFKGIKRRINLDDARDQSRSSFAVNRLRQSVNYRQSVVEQNNLNLVSAPSTLHKTFFSKVSAVAETHRQQLVWLFIFFATNVVLFAYRFYIVNNGNKNDMGRITGVGIAVARGSAYALMFNMALILLTVCRNLMTFLRETAIGDFVPFDNAIAFHRIVGFMIAFWALVHTGSHLFNFYRVTCQSAESISCMFPQPIFGSDYVPTFSFWLYETVTGFTGVAIIVFMCIIYVFAMPYFVRNIYYAFRLTHYLNIVFYVLTFLHGFPKLLSSPLFLDFITWPTIIFIIDKVMGLRQKYANLEIVKATILPSEIVHIAFERPAGFFYLSGQWLRVSSPDFSTDLHEQHAFSIASAPLDQHIELYIKAVGPWTKRLKKEISEAQAQAKTKGGILQYPRINLRGPYGDGNQEWMNFEVAVLIGGGIGVTPYASTLKDLVQKTRLGQHHTVRCSKVYYLWICPSHKSYEWFVDVLRKIEKEDNEDGNPILETHIFITQFFHKFDLRTTMLYICEKHFRGNNAGVSMFTGLRAANHFGRPNFNEFFRFVQHMHPTVSDVGVFSCGPSMVNKQISTACASANRVRDAPSFQHRFESF